MTRDDEGGGRQKFQKSNDVICMVPRAALRV